MAKQSTSNKKTPKKKVETRGGSRSNAGRKPVYDEEAETVSFYIPKTLIPKITTYVTKECKRLRRKTVPVESLQSD